MAERAGIFPRGGRWTTHHKARLVQAVADGALLLTELVDAGISVEEFVGWERAFAAHGRNGLLAGYRDREKVAPAAGAG